METQAPSMAPHGYDPNMMYYYPGFGYPPPPQMPAGDMEEFHKNRQKMSMKHQQQMAEMGFFPNAMYPNPAMMRGRPSPPAAGAVGTGTTTSQKGASGKMENAQGPPPPPPRSPSSSSSSSQQPQTTSQGPPYPYMHPMYNPMAMYPPYYNEMMWSHPHAIPTGHGTKMSSNKQGSTSPPMPPSASTPVLKETNSQQPSKASSPPGQPLHHPGGQPPHPQSYYQSRLDMTPKKRTSGRVQYDTSGMMFSEDSITDVANNIFSGSTANPILSRPRYQTPRKKKAFHKLDLLNHVEIPHKKPRVYENDKFNRGIWTDKEHKRFLEGIRMFSRGKWKEIAEHVRTRSRVQVASHAQKYFQRNDME